MLDLPTLDGPVKMRIPEGTQPGRVFRIRGRGIPQALVGFLKGKKDLGVHTEMISDDVIELIEAGAITGARKTVVARTLSAQSAPRQNCQDWPRSRLRARRPRRRSTPWTRSRSSARTERSGRDGRGGARAAARSRGLDRAVAAYGTPREILTDQPQIFETHRENFTISTDPARLDLDVIVDMLTRAYWAVGRPRERTERAIRNSLVFGVYDGDKQIGLARVVSDYSIFAYLCDVFIHENYRAHGLGKWLIQTVMEHPDLKEMRRWVLVTTDAHGLYNKFGFTSIEDPDIREVALGGRHQGIFGGPKGTATGAHSLLVRSLFFTEDEGKVRWYFALAAGD